MNPKAVALEERTDRVFVRVCTFCESLPVNSTTASVSAQLTDSAGSPDSNYRAACRARSTNEFIAKIAVAAEEADESKGWLLALQARSYGDADETRALIHEADELTAIFTASHKTASKRRDHERVRLETSRSLRKHRAR